MPAPLAAETIVVGGGVAGLTCAAGLAEHGCKVLLLERQSRLGGRAQSWRDETTGDIVDIGPHIFHSRYFNLLRLLDRCGTAPSIAWLDDPLLTLVDGGSVVRIPASGLVEPLHFLPGMRVAPLPLRDKLSNVRATLRAMALDERDFRALDAVSAADWLADAGVSPRFREWFWASACIVIMNTPLAQCSAGALLRFYQQLIGHNDVRLGIGRAALGELIGGPAGRYVTERGGTIRLDAPVARFRDGADGIEAVVLADGTELAARTYVLAVAPAEQTALAPADALVAGSAPRVEVPPPCPYVSVYLWFDRRLGSTAMWSRTWGATKLSYDCYDLANVRTGWDHRDSVIAANIIRSDRVGDRTDAQLVAGVRDDIAEYYPAARAARLLHSRVHRIPLAINYPAVGSEARRPLIRTRRPNLFLASDWCDTCLPSSMESAARAGWLAAEAVLAAAGRSACLAAEPDLPSGLVGLVRRAASALRGRRGE